MTGPAVGSGPRHLEAELPQPILSTTGPRSVIEVYNQQQVALYEGLVADANAAVCTDATTNGKAEAVLLRLHDAMKAVEARRAELKKPITQIGKAIDEIAAKLEAPMDVAKRALQGRIIAFKAKEREQAEQARRDAEEKARRERLAAEEAARVKAAAEAKELAEVLGEPVVVEPEPVKAPAPAALPAVPTASAAVQVRKVMRLEITDASKIPHRIGDTVLMVPDHAALKRVLGLGIEVPGARMVEDEQLAMRRA